MSEISGWGQELVERYPDPTFWPVYDGSNKKDVYRYAQLWMTEGIPFAFRHKPMVFQLAREKVAAALSIESKCVSLTGSASTGFSYSPNKFGVGYEPGRSDIDLLVVSEELFTRTARDFDLFVTRFRAGLEVPQTRAEATYWPHNVMQVPKNIQKGFIDQNRIPAKNEYLAGRRLGSAAQLFRRSVNREIGGEIGRVSIRVYKSWEIVISQIGGSLLKALIQRAE